MVKTDRKKMHQSVRKAGYYEYLFSRERVPRGGCTVRLGRCVAQAWMPMAPVSGPVPGLEGAFVLIRRPSKAGALYTE